MRITSSPAVRLLRRYSSCAVPLPEKALIAQIRRLAGVDPRVRAGSLHRRARLSQERRSRPESGMTARSCGSCSADKKP